MQAMSAIINQSQMSTQDFDPSSLNEDFFEQMLSTLPPSSWPDLTMAAAIGTHKSGDVAASGDQEHYDTQRQFLLDHDQSAALASKLRQHQISSGEGNSVSAAAMKSLLLQQQLLLESRGLGGGGLHFPAGDPGTVDSGLSPMPHSLGNGHGVVNASSFTPPNSGIDDSVQALYNVFAGSLSGQASDQAQHLQHTQDGGMQAQSFGAPAASGSAGGGGAAAQPRQRVRARRGQATDPHSIAERLRRERIAERMKALQELVPNANKTDKASMLDEIIDYVKFLQLQVKVLSMSRLGGAAAVAPLVADVASEGTGDRTQTRANGGPTASTSNPNDSITVTEHQVAKLMEEDMGSAMQYLQGKGLCLMPISLAAAISTATGRNPIAGAGPSSPSISGLTVQSTTLVNGGGDSSV